MKYVVYTTKEIHRVEADDILWGNGVVQFISKQEDTNSIIKLEVTPKPIVAFSFNNLVKVEYIHEED
jgi:hypothetical protein